MSDAFAVDAEWCLTTQKGRDDVSPRFRVALRT